MTRPLRPTPYQTTLGDLGNALNEIYRTAGWRSNYPVQFEYQRDDISGETHGLEGNTPTEDDEPSIDPDLIPDRMRAIEAGDFDEFEPEDE